MLQQNILVNYLNVKRSFIDVPMWVKNSPSIRNGDDTFSSMIDAIELVSCILIAAKS